MAGSPINPGSHGSGSGPSIGFPLGTALVLLMIFSLSGIFSCCYHWEKLRRSFSSHGADPRVGSSKPTAPSMDVNNEGMPVIMAGDNIPKFIALPCPCNKPLANRENQLPIAFP
ncbi:uncharacterized protein At5g65660-like [Primulina huaijiensis]|uniref:uncharacterized protein At5g65660-like n=1 Tax=Primulina huaijiensis TaxID=1492673 RepID=UPI003CC736B7